MKALSAVSSVKAIQLFQLFRFAAVFLTGSILAHNDFSTEEISHYETFLFISYAATFFWLSGIINSFLALFPKSDEHDKRALIFNTALMLSCISIIAAAFIAGFSATSLIQSPYSKLIIVYVAIYVPSYLIEYIFLVLEQNTRLIIYGVVSFLLHILMVTLVLLYNPQIEIVLWTLIALAAIKIILLIALLLKYSSFNLSIQHIKQLGVSSFPLAVSYLLSGSSELIDGIIVKKYFSEESFAIFRYGARELPIVLLMANAFSSAAIPKIADNLEDGLVLIKKNSLQLFNLFFPVTIILMFFSKQLFVIVFNAEFEESAFIFNIYLLLIISRLLFPQTILNGLGKNKFLMVSAFFEVIVNVTASISLMQYFGLPGIAMGTVIANLFDKLLLIGYCKFKLNIEPGLYISIFQHFFFSFMLAIVAYLLFLS